MNYDIIALCTECTASSKDATDVSDVRQNNGLRPGGGGGVPDNAPVVLETRRYRAPTTTYRPRRRTACPAVRAAA